MESEKTCGMGRWGVAMWSGIAGLLLLPLAAMSVTDEVAWTPFDFIVAGVLLIGAGAAFEFGSRFLRNGRSRLIAGLVVVAIVGFVWAQGAVGVF
jgi:hypothetical protein